MGVCCTTLYAAAVVNDTYDSDASWDVVIGCAPDACSLLLKSPCRLPVFTHSALQVWAVERCANDLTGTGRTLLFISH